MTKHIWHSFTYRLRRLRYLAASFEDNGFVITDRFSDVDQDCYIIILQKGQTTLNLQARLHGIEIYVNGRLSSVQPYGRQRVVCE